MSSSKYLPTPPGRVDTTKLPRQPLFGIQAGLEVKNFSVTRPPMTNSPVINNNGVFYVNEDLGAAQKKMDAMAKANPTKAGEIFQKFTKMVVLSSVGDLEGVLGLMASTGHGAPPPWFAVKMFQTGVLAMKLEVPRFMSKNGFDVKMGPLKTLMFDLVAANTKEKLVMKSKGLGGRNKEVLARDRLYVESMLFLSVECGFDAMEMRKEDYYSLLHLAAAGDLAQMCLCLLQLGCDVNSVAKDDAMPLGLALDAGAGDVVKVLKARGGKETWRKDVKQIVPPAGWGMEAKGARRGGGVDAVATKVRGLKLSMGDRIETGHGILGGVKEEEEEEEEEEEGYNKYTFSCGE